VPRRRTDNRSGLAPLVEIAVRASERGSAHWDADWAFVKELGARTALSSVSSARPCSDAMVRVAFARLCETVERQSLVTLIAHRGDDRIGFLLMLDQLPDEVTLLPQGFLAYLAVEPERRRAGVGTALLDAAEDEARRRGLPYMSLIVSQENRGARRLYKRRGYQTERRVLCKAL